MSGLHFVDTRRPAWGHKAMVQLDKPLPAREAIQAADLDFEIVKEPLFTRLGSEVIQIDGKYAVINPKTQQVYATGVGADYQYLQNQQLAAALDEIITPHYPVTAIGETLNGEGLLFVLDAGESTMLGEGLHQYFLVVEYRNGKDALKWAFSALRFWCTNTLLTALSQAAMLVNARHDSRFTINVRGGLEFVAGAEKSREETHQLFEALGRRRLQPAELNQYLLNVYPDPDDKKLLALDNVMTTTPSPYLEAQYETRAKSYATRKAAAVSHRDKAAELFQYFGTDQPDLRGTLWAAYNVVAEVEDHMIGAGAKQDSVLQSALLGDRAQVKVRALNEAKVLLHA